MKHLLSRTSLFAVVALGAAFGTEDPVPPPEQILSAEGHRRTTIYQSPQSPRYTCWVGAWSMPDGALMVCFTRATGPTSDRPRAPADVLHRLSMTALIRKD